MQFKRMSDLSRCVITRTLLHPAYLHHDTRFLNESRAAHNYVNVAQQLFEPRQQPSLSVTFSAEKLRAARERRKPTALERSRRNCDCFAKHAVYRNPQASAMREAALRQSVSAYIQHGTDVIISCN